MAGKFGSDFNPNQPADDDLARYGAREFQDIKARIKNTFGVRFNLETGELKDNSISTYQIQAVTPDPSGVWNTVTVNSRGQVTAGELTSSVLPDRSPSPAGTWGRVVVNAKGLVESGTAETALAANYAMLEYKVASSASISPEAVVLTTWTNKALSHCTPTAGVDEVITALDTGTGVFTVAAGSYIVFGQFAFREIQEIGARLQGTSPDSTLLSGIVTSAQQNEQTGVGLIQGVLVLASDTEMRWQYYARAANSDEDFGKGKNSGTDDIFSSLMFVGITA